MNKEMLHVEVISVELLVTPNTVNLRV